MSRRLVTPRRLIGLVVAVQGAVSLVTVPLWYWQGSRQHAAAAALEEKHWWLEREGADHTRSYSQLTYWCETLAPTVDHVHPVTAVEFGGWHRPTPSDLDLLTRLSFVEDVRLHRFPGEATDTIIPRVATLPSLERLTLSDAGLGPEAAGHLAGCRTLRSLTIVQDEIDQPLLDVLASLDQLESLTLYTVTLSPADKAMLQKRLPHCDVQVHGGLGDLR